LSFLSSVFVAIIGQEGTNCPKEKGWAIDTIGLATELLVPIMMRDVSSFSSPRVILAGNPTQGRKTCLVPSIRSGSMLGFERLEDNKVGRYR
jgi:hypothetical protein